VPLFRSIGQWVIGVSLGLYFTAPVVGVLAEHLVSVVGGLLFAIGLAFYGTYLLRRFANVDVKTAWFSSAIGGAAEMTNLAERYGVRPDLVASAHSMRMITVVVLVPFTLQWLGISGIDSFVVGAKQISYTGLAQLFGLTAIGVFVATRMKMPNAWVLGPMFLTIGITASGMEFSAIPDWLSKVAQLSVGWGLGDRFRPGFFRTAPRFLMVVVVFTATALLLAFGFATLLHMVSGLPTVSLMLGVAPGGISEMAITAKVLQLGVPLVTAFQVFRMAGVVLVTGPLYAYVISRYFQNYGVRSR
jgi:membrane AbrB-like protein